jgi:glutamate-1-semialdehyde 2,1-aminomutase
VDNQQLYQRARQIIPGGTQLLSKRPEMYAPGKWPPYFRAAAGCRVTDLDGKTYLDMSTMGIGSCLLGYNDPDVTPAVVARIQAGSMSTLNCPEDVALAELLLEIHPWAQQVRYARTGGEAMTVAVRLARAKSNRATIAFCGYHGWHDWYLAANLVDSGKSDALGGHLLPGLSPRGVPQNLAGTQLAFAYNDLDSLAAIVREHGPQLAAVVMEPTRNVHPAPGFLEGVRELCDSCNAALVFDEITAGWRMALGGAHLRYGVNPDVAVFAKALGNGHPMAAIIGTRGVMEAAQESFVSSTYWTEAVGPTAALATVTKMRTTNVPQHIEQIGSALRSGLTELAQTHGVPLKLAGHAALTSIAFDHADNLSLQTLLTVRALDHGILAGSGFYPALAHTTADVQQYLAAADPIFAELRQAIDAGDVSNRIDGATRHSGFARLT